MMHIIWQYPNSNLLELVWQSQNQLFWELLLN